MAIYLYIFLFFINVLAFCLYALDKRKAVYGMRRISEAALLTLAAVGGAYGAGMGMMLFRHKTKHKSFLITVPICFVLWMVILVLLCVI